MMHWVSWLLGFVHHPRAPIDPEEIRAEMTANDPDFARIRQKQHEALQALTAKRIADGLAIQTERQFWEKTEIQRSEKKPDDE